MTDKPIPDDELEELEEENGSETLIVPPPNYHERLMAAQRARANEARKMVEIPSPLSKPDTPAPAPVDETKPGPPADKPEAVPNTVAAAKEAPPEQKAAKLTKSNSSKKTRPSQKPPKSNP